MAISTKATLRTAIGDWLARSDLSSTRLDDMIGFAIDYFNYGGEPTEDPPLRVRDMEAVSDLTPASGICTLPTDYLQYRRVVEKVSPRRPLGYITPDQAEHMYPSRDGGLTDKFTVVGASLYTFPLSTDTIELTYYQKLPQLAADGDANWLLLKAPQLMLRACLMQASDYIDDPDKIAKNVAFVRGLVAGMNHQNTLANYARAGLMMTGPTP